MLVMVARQSGHAFPTLNRGAQLRHTHLCAESPCTNAWLGGASSQHTHSRGGGAGCAGMPGAPSMCTPSMPSTGRPCHFRPMQHQQASTTATATNVMLAATAPTTNVADAPMLKSVDASLTVTLAGVADGVPVGEGGAISSSAGAPYERVTEGVAVCDADGDGDGVTEAVAEADVLGEGRGLVDVSANKVLAEISARVVCQGHVKQAARGSTWGAENGTHKLPGSDKLNSCPGAPNTGPCVDTPTPTVSTTVPVSQCNDVMDASLATYT